MALIIFTLLCSHQTKPVSNFFPLPQTEMLNASLSSNSQVLLNPNLLCLHEFAYSGILYKWRPIFVLLYQAYFTQASSMLQHVWEFILSCGWIIFYWMYRPYLFIHSSAGHLGCFHLLATLHKAEINSWCLSPCFQFFGVYT